MGTRRSKSRLRKLGVTFTLLIAAIVSGCTERSEKAASGEKVEKSSQECQFQLIPANDGEYLVRRYRFEDFARRQYDIQYALSLDFIEETEKNYGISRTEYFESFKKMSESYISVKKREYPGKKIKLSVNENGKWRLSAPTDILQDCTDSFKQSIRKFENSYDLKHRIVRIADEHGYRLRPDFRAIKKWQAPMVADLFLRFRTTALDNRLNERELILLLVDFVQQLRYQIPPEESGSRTTLGYWPPIICLKEQAGDCDSKSVLFASLYHWIKDSGCALVLIRNHAFIAIKNRHKIFPKDKYTRIGGEDYLLIETTGRWPAGKVGNEIISKMKRMNFDMINLD